MASAWGLMTFLNVVAPAYCYCSCRRGGGAAAGGGGGGGGASAFGFDYPGILSSWPIGHGT